MFAVVVSIGAVIGALLRAMGQARMDSISWIPWGTLACNLSGCFIVGLVYPIIKTHSFWASLIFVGALGAFTTFSSFAIQIVQMIANHQYNHALVYWLFSSLGCVVACYVGFFLNKQLQG